MASRSPKEQTESSVLAAKQQRGSQRIKLFAYVDSTQIIQFQVPEWVGKLAGEAETAWVNAQPPESAVFFVPKKPTKDSSTTDENYSTPGTPETRNVREKGAGAKNPSRMNIYRKVTLLLVAGHGQTRGAGGTGKEYKRRSIRLPSAMNARAIQYWLKESPIKDKVSGFKLGRLEYPVGDASVTQASLGKLRSKTVEATSKT